MAELSGTAFLSFGCICGWGSAHCCASVYRSSHLQTPFFHRTLLSLGFRRPKAAMAGCCGYTLPDPPGEIWEPNAGNFARIPWIWPNATVSDR